VAIGETGLDFYYNDQSSAAKQQESFLLQIGLARRRQLPVIIHSRNAWPELFTLLEKVDSEYLRQVGAVLHCFTGDPSIAQRATTMGIYVSFSGIVTFPKSAEIQAAAKTVDGHFLLVETDAPYLAPQGHRGAPKNNEPAYMVVTAEKLATLRGCTLQEISDTTTANARRLFRI